MQTATPIALGNETRLHVAMINMSDEDSLFDSPPDSIPDIDGHFSEEDDDLLPSAITCKTEPPIAGRHVTTTSDSLRVPGVATLPPGAATLPFGAAKLSPLNLSPVKRGGNLEEERKAVLHLSQLVKPVFKTIRAIDRHQAIDSKVDGYRDQGGIKGLSKRVRDRMEREADSPDCPSPSSSVDSKMGGDNKITIHLPVFPPGTSLFTAPPTLMADISLPSVGGLPPFLANTLSQGGGSTILRELLVGQRLAILFSSRPCPREIVVWLLEVSCLCSEDNMRMSAFYSLCQLLRASSVAIFPPDVWKVVTHLGGAESGGEGGYVHSPQEQFLVAQGVSRLLQFLMHCLGRRPYNVEQTKELFGLVLRLALDPLVCQCTVCVGTPVGGVLAALEGSIANEDDWAVIKSHVLALVSSLTSHHHNKLYIVELFTSNSQRTRQLQRELLKQALWSVVGGANSTVPEIEDGENMEMEIQQQTSSQPIDNMSTSDYELAKSVLLHYFKIDNADINYYEAHSVIKLLAMLLRRPDFHWESKDSRRDFVRLLSDFNSRKMRDSIFELERGLVKDLVIRLKLELQEGREGLRQTDLFSYF